MHRWPSALRSTTLHNQTRPTNEHLQFVHHTYPHHPRAEYVVPRNGERPVHHLECFLQCIVQRRLVYLVSTSAFKKCENDARQTALPSRRTLLRLRGARTHFLPVPAPYSQIWISARRPSPVSLSCSASSRLHHQPQLENIAVGGDNSQHSRICAPTCSTSSPLRQARRRTVLAPHRADHTRCGTQPRSCPVRRSVSGRLGTQREPGQTACGAGS